MIKLTLVTLLACVVMVCSAHEGNKTSEESMKHWKSWHTKVKYPIYAESIMWGHLKNGDEKTKITGWVRFVQPGFNEPVQVSVNITARPPFTSEFLGVSHGLHIHEFGTVWSKNTTMRCGASGSHYNPTNMTHGLREDSVRHVGDLGNIDMSKEDGQFVTSFNDSQLHLVGFQTIVGRTVVLHEKIDDGGKTKDPMSALTGSAGARIACGDIVYSPKF